jgi:hypothetical protein
MARKEHLAWCKARATEYAKAGDATNAVASMVSDMNKHPETQLDPMLAMMGMMEIKSGLPAVQRWIDGFN